MANRVLTDRNSQLAAAGEARIRSGEMPTDEQLQALGASEPEVRGWLAIQAMGDADTGAEIAEELFEGEFKQSSNASSVDELKPASLMDELISQEKKHTPSEVVMVTKTARGELCWLEKGTEQSGLKHILERHSDDFSRKNITDIPRLLKDLLKTDSINRGGNAKGFYADYMWDGNTYRVAYGTNGYIVSVYPID